jgi:hypothetical protein
VLAPLRLAELHLGQLHLAEAEPVAEAEFVAEAEPVDTTLEYCHTSIVSEIRLHSTSIAKKLRS